MIKLDRKLCEKKIYIYICYWLNIVNINYISQKTRFTSNKRERKDKEIYNILYLCMGTHFHFHRYLRHHGSCSRYTEKLNPTGNVHEKILDQS